MVQEYEDKRVEQKVVSQIQIVLPPLLKSVLPAALEDAVKLLEAKQENAKNAKYLSSAAHVLGEPSYDGGWPTPAGAMVVRGPHEAQRARARRGSFDERRAADPRPGCRRASCDGLCARDLERMHCHKFAGA